MIEVDGKPVFPSYRVERGEYKTQLDLQYGVIAIMHPYDIVQKLGEAGEFKKAFAALEGFLHREIDIKAQAAVLELYNRSNS